MIRIILTLCLFFIGANAYSQAPLIIRNDGKSTALDSNLFVGKSFRPPAFNDTTQANQSIKVLDSSGRIIFTRDSSTLWVRNVGKYWQKLVSGSGVVTLQQAFNADPTANPDINAGNNTFLIAGDNDLGGVSRLIVGNNQGAQLYSKLDNTSYVNAKADGTIEISSASTGSNSQKLVMNESKSYLVSGGNSGSDTSLTKLGVGTLYPEAPLDVSGAPRFRTPSAQDGYVWTATNDKGDGEWEVASTVDSSTYFTTFRADTMRSNLYGAIGNVPTPTLQQVLDAGNNAINQNISLLEPIQNNIIYTNINDINPATTNISPSINLENLDGISYTKLFHDKSEGMYLITNNGASDSTYIRQTPAQFIINSTTDVAIQTPSFYASNLTTQAPIRFISDSAAAGYVWTAKDTTGHGEWRQSSAADSSVYFTNYRADTMRNNIYSAIGNVPIPTLQQVLNAGKNVANNQNIEMADTVNMFGIQYPDNANFGGGAGFVGVEVTSSGKVGSVLRNDAGKIEIDNANGITIDGTYSGTYANGNFNFNDTAKFFKPITIQTDSAQAGYVWTSKDNTGQGEWRQSSAADSSVYFTNYRADTMRSNLYANKVPYTGAYQDVDLGAFKLNAQAVHIKGTAGNGHLGLKHQSSAVTASGQETSIYADNNGDVAWKNDNLYITTLKTSGNTADRVYTFPDSTGTVALLSNLTTKANTAGGIFTDSIVLTSTVGGISLPNMTQTQMNAITPRLGTQIYNTTYDAVCTYTNDFGWWSNDQPWISSNGWMVNDEFVTYAYANNQNGNFFQIQNSNGTWTSATPLSNRPGILTMSTGTNAAGRLTVQADGIGLASNIVGGGKMIFETDVQIPTLSSSAEPFRFFTGLNSVNTNVSTNSIAFLYDSAGANTGSFASGNWQIVTANNNNRSYFRTDSVVTAGRWYRFRTEINAAADTVRFYINGALVRTQTTNIPTTSLTYASSIIKGGTGTTPRTAWVDFIRIRQKFTTAR